jgi:hypothetical protein
MRAHTHTPRVVAHSARGVRCRITKFHQLTLRIVVIPTLVVMILLVIVMSTFVILLYNTPYVLVNGQLDPDSTFFKLLSALEIVRALAPPRAHAHSSSRVCARAHAHTGGRRVRPDHRRGILRLQRADRPHDLQVPDLLAQAAPGARSRSRSCVCARARCRLRVRPQFLVITVIFDVTLVVRMIVIVAIRDSYTELQRVIVLVVYVACEIFPVLLVFAMVLVRTPATRARFSGNKETSRLVPDSDQ